MMKFIASWVSLMMAMTNNSPNSKPENILQNDPLLERNDATSLSYLLQSNQITAVELMERTLKQISIWNPHVNAIVGLRDEEELLEEARRADEKLIRQNHGGEGKKDSKNGSNLGWLVGIPIAIKELSNVKGFPSTNGGSPLYCTQESLRDKTLCCCDFNDPFVQNLIDEGAIIIGKTNAPEMGLGSHTYNSLYGTTLNPYDLKVSAGGSSGGAGVALATRMISIADGSDMMGSLRNPAGWNNVYSLRPSIHLTDDQNNHDSENNTTPLGYSISTVGPMARTPRDIAMLLQTMTTPKDFSSIVNGHRFSAKSVLDFCILDEKKRKMHDYNLKKKHKKIGWLRNWGGAYEIQPEILQLCENALSKLTESTSLKYVEAIHNPPFEADKLWYSWVTIRSHMISQQILDEFDETCIFSPDSKVKSSVKFEVEKGKRLSATDVENAKTIAKAWSLKANDLLGSPHGFFALALPSAQVFPFPSHLEWPKSINDHQMDTYHRWMEVVVSVSLLGLPCVTLPVGFGNDGLPIGLQLFSKKGSDADLLCLAQEYHELVDWPTKIVPTPFVTK